MSAIDSIISQLVLERDRFERVLAILQETGSKMADTLTKVGRAGTSLPKRRFSAATRRKMALAQKKRCPARKGQPEPRPAAAKQAAKTTKKRKLSAAGLANIRAAVARRWAEAAKQATATKKIAAKKSAPAAAKKTVTKKATRKPAGKAVRKSASAATPAPVAEADS